MNFQEHPNEASLISSEQAVHDFEGIVHQNICQDILPLLLLKQSM